MEKYSKARHLFNCVETQNDNEHYLWSIHETKTVDNTIKIKKGERCICKYQRHYDGQCGHELRICFKFKENHFNERWYTTRKYKSLHPTFDQMTNISTSIRSCVEILPNNNDVQTSMDPLVNANDDIMSTSSRNKLVCHKDMTNTFDQLCTTVNGNQEAMKKVMFIISDLTSNFRRFKDVDIQIYPKVLPPVNMDNTKSSEIMPVAAVLHPIHHHKRNSRLKGVKEIVTKRKHSEYRQSNVIANDIAFISQPSQRNSQNTF